MVGSKIKRSQGQNVCPLRDVNETVRSMQIKNINSFFPDVVPERIPHNVLGEAASTAWWEQRGDQISGLQHSVLVEAFDTCSRVPIHTKPGLQSSTTLMSQMEMGKLDCCVY